ncbi:homeobox protein CHOX-7-like [Myotis lucifugus]|uniref:homeobox protein CHOX-7-like n=1 Tax=Myotis lucifugus TaxID=59463 RepID=UPI0003C422B8|nr:homeobox protein CHOX-7-like [Myotis lucifugus]
MQEPESPPGSPPSPAHGSKRRKRTVYSIEQRLQLEEFYKKKRYGTYEERETLAKQVKVQEEQVQVWLKNRRAKDRRLQRLSGQQGQGAHAAPQEPGAPAPQPAPAPGAQSVVLAAAAPAPAKDTVGPQGPYTFNFFPDPVVTPGYTELLSPKSPFEAQFSFCTPWDESEEDFYKLLDL